MATKIERNALATIGAFAKVTDTIEKTFRERYPHAKIIDAPMSFRSWICEVDGHEHVAQIEGEKYSLVSDDGSIRFVIGEGDVITLLF